MLLLKKKKKNYNAKKKTLIVLERFKKMSFYYQLFSIVPLFDEFILYRAHTILSGSGITAICSD